MYKAALVNKYGDIVCWLVQRGPYWKLPEDFDVLMDIGDEYHVELIG